MISSSYREDAGRSRFGRVLFFHAKRNKNVISCVCYWCYCRRTVSHHFWHRGTSRQTSFEPFAAPQRRCFEVRKGDTIRSVWLPGSYHMDIRATHMPTLQTRCTPRPYDRDAHASQHTRFSYGHVTVHRRIRVPRNASKVVRPGSDKGPHRT